MKINILDLIDFERVDPLLEGFNKLTGFATAILDLEGNVLSKMGWSQMCTSFHRIHPETSKRCTISNTQLAGKLAEGKRYHSNKCLNGLIDVAVPIEIKGEHIANLFTGQFLYEEPDRKFFKMQAGKYGFDEEKYLKALETVPVVSEEKVKIAMEFLLNVTEMIIEMTQQKIEQIELSNTLKKNDEHLRSIFTAMSEGFSILDVICDESGNPRDLRFVNVNPAFEQQTGLKNEDILGHTLLELFPTSEVYWIERFGNVGLTGEPISFEAMFGPLNTYYHVNAFQTKPGQTGTMFTNINERKLAEILVRDEKEQKRAILELVGDPIFLKDKDHRIIFANRAFLDLFGLDKKNVIGKTLAENVPENERKQFLEVDRNVLETGISDCREEALTLGGQTHTIITRKARLIDESGNKFLVGSIHNITERKAAEKKLKENEQRLSSIFDAVGDVIFMLKVEAGDQYRFVSVNNSFAKVTGIPEEMILGKRVNEVIPKASLPFVLNEYRMAIKTKSLRRWEETSDYPNWRLIGDVCIVPIYNDQGDCTHLIGSVHDITERKQAEIKLKEYSNRLSATLESISDAFVSLDNNWCYTYMNKKAGEIFGRYPQEMIGKHIWTEFPEGIGQPFYHTYYKAVETQEFQFLEEYYPPYDRWFENRIYPTKDGLSIFFHDISDRKRAENTILQKSKDLTALLKISQTLSATLNIEIVLQNIIDNATKLIGLDTGAIYLVNGLDLFLGATYPPTPPEFPDEFRHALLEDHPHINKAISTGLPIILSDLETADLSPAEKAITESRSMRSLLYIPLLIDKRTNGVLILGTQNVTRRFTKAEINLFQTI